MPLPTDSSDICFRGGQATLQRNLWRNWPDGIRETLENGKESLEVCDTGMSHLGQTGSWDRGLFLYHPSIWNSFRNTG